MVCLEKGVFDYKSEIMIWFNSINHRNNTLVYMWSYKREIFFIKIIKILK